MTEEDVHIGTASISMGFSHPSHPRRRPASRWLSHAWSWEEPEIEAEETERENPRDIWGTPGECYCGSPEQRKCQMKEKKKNVFLANSLEKPQDSFWEWVRQGSRAAEQLRVFFLCVGLCHKITSDKRAPSPCRPPLRSRKTPSPPPGAFWEKHPRTHTGPSRSRYSL